MPRGDGTGPRGQGPKTGRGMGKGGGSRGGGGGQTQGGGQGRGGGQTQGGGQGRGGGMGSGPGGYCVCPNCGEKTPHQMGTPCYEQQCPKCGTAMTRE